jgi:hypothetical protein
MLVAQSKWPPQLRMPDRNLQVSVTAPYGVGASLLRKHKTLPRPQPEEFIRIYPTIPSSRPRALSIDTGLASAPTSPDQSPRTLKHSSRRIGHPDLPPTPPTHSRQSSSGGAVVEQPMKHDKPSKSPSIPTTPPNHQSPPTPDVTPPRTAPRSSAPRLPPSDRYPSSRTDSFKTARENPYSSDEDEVSTVRPNLPSARPSQVDIPQMSTKLASPTKLKAREIGLGLRLESDNESTPSPGQPGQNRFSFQSNATNDFGTFDGEWSSVGEPDEVEWEWDNNLMGNVSVRRRPARKSYIYKAEPSSEVINDNPVTPTNATRRLREYPLEATIGISPLQSEPRDHTPIYRFKSSMRPAMTGSESPTTPDFRRFSAASARSGSAVIEAMVIDAPPQQQQTLRHRKKQLGLREFSSDQSNQSSLSGSITSGDMARRLAHKHPRVFSRERQSHSSSVTATSASSSVKSRKQVWSEGSIPVVVVPERRSSMKSARTPSLRSTSSRRAKRSMSLNSTPLAQSSRTKENKHSDLPHRGRRTTSESAGSSANSQRTIDFPPNIPVRRSSLSAPTSRNTSRAASLTAESLKAHNLIHSENYKPGAPRRPSLESQRESKHLAPKLSVDHNGDPFFGSRLSAAVTPFSQVSYETTGTSAELSEALAVQMYPHQNKSLLVIQQLAQPITTSQRSSGTIRPPAEPAAAVDGTATEPPVTPPQPSHATDELDSPLRNPREPPQPPAIKFIPATPGGLTPAQEHEHQLGYDEARLAATDRKPKRGLSLIRRALSNRRGAESMISRTFSTRRRELIDEPTQASKGSITAGSLFPSVADHPSDSTKLHPFWRPAHFWDDLEGDDYDGYEPDAYPLVDNRPLKRSFTGSLKRTFAILPIRDDPSHDHYLTERRTVQRTRSGNLRVVKNRSNESLRRAAIDSRYHPRHTGTGGNRDRAEANANRGRHMQWTGIGESWRGLSRRMSERRRARRNDKLRSMISGPQNPVDGVARIIAGDVRA